MTLELEEFLPFRPTLGTERRAKWAVGERSERFRSGMWLPAFLKGNREVPCSGPEVSEQPGGFLAARKSFGLKLFRF